MYVIEFCASDALEMIVAPVWRHGLRQEDYLEKQLDPVALRPLASIEAMALAVWLNASRSALLQHSQNMFYFVERRRIASDFAHIGAFRQLKKCFNCLSK